MLFSRRSATSACAVALIVMAVTPYHRFSSSIGLASGAMTWLVILGACLAAFGHGVALRKGREIRRPIALPRYRCFPWCYCYGSRMGRLGLLCSRRFYSIRVCAYLAVARRFMRLVLHWVVAPLICNLEYGGLSFDTGGGAGRRKGDPPTAERTFCRNSSCPVLPAVLLSSFMESRSRAMGDVSCNGRINWPYAFNSSGLSHVGCGPAALLSPRPWSGAGRRVCPFCARSSSYWPCSGCRGGILCKRCHGHCITVDGVRYCCCRLRIHIAKGETGQQFGYPSHVRPIRCGGVFPCPVASRRAVCSTAAQRENAGGNCQGDGYEAIDGANNASPSIREGVGCGLTRARGVVCG